MVGAIPFEEFHFSSFHSLGAFIQTLASAFGYTVIAPLSPTATNGQTAAEISSSPTSIPSATVAPNSNGIRTTSEQQRGEAGQKGNNEPATINVSGTLTMNVNGDNGKIGTVDIIKMLENNPTFRQELAKALADTYAKMDKSGLISN